MACTGRLSHAQTFKLDKDLEELAQFERSSDAQTTELVKDLKELEQLSKRKKPPKHVERLSDAQIAAVAKDWEEFENGFEEPGYHAHVKRRLNSYRSKAKHRKDKITQRSSDPQIDKIAKVVSDFEEIEQNDTEDQQVRLCNAKYLTRAFVKRRVESYLISRWKKNQEDLGQASSSSSESLQAKNVS